jgi:hypothetical protein
LKKLLTKEGKIRGKSLATEFIPLDGILLTLWLDEYYSQAITIAKSFLKTKGTVESVRLIIDGKPMGRVLQANGKTLDAFMVYGSGSQLVDGSEEQGVQLIDGFLFRIRTKNEQR